MSPELLSRFKVYQINEYNALEFRNVVTNALVSHESLSQDEASEIALRLVGKTHDVRDAVRVARLSKRVGIQRAVELLVGR
jgi:Holliday junction DNA helicase RuvB